jgi:hypothetical protein
VMDDTGVSPVSSPRRMLQIQPPVAFSTYFDGCFSLS